MQTAQGTIVVVRQVPRRTVTVFGFLDDWRTARGRLHDPTDTKTAAGRFMEFMLVAAKTYEREQTSEKVRSKMRMRAEKGMWNGGPIPFGFVQTDDSRTIAPDPEKKTILNEMFRVYVETGSDFKVRDWLKAHQIPTREGRATWQVSTLRKILTNRRYIAQIEINRENKELKDLPESEAYRVAPAPYEPIVAVEVFQMAQDIRAQKAAESPNRKGRPRSFSQTQCQRVYPLQRIIVCAHCGHSMAPWYVNIKLEKTRAAKSARTTATFTIIYVPNNRRTGKPATTKIVLRRAKRKIGYGNACAI